MESVNYEKISKWIIFAAMGTPILVAVCCDFWIVDRIKDLGQVGDFLAGTTVPLLTLAAFILLYGSYKLQKKEMRESAGALQEQASSLQKQIEIMQSQSNQKIFFDLIELLDKNRKIELDTKIFGNSAKSSFKVIDSLFEAYDIQSDNKERLQILRGKNPTVASYIDAVMGEEAYKYFNALTGVLKFMDNVSIDQQSRQLFEIVFQAGIDLAEKRFLIMYANSKLPFVDSYIVTRLERLNVLEWNTANIEYGS